MEDQNSLDIREGPEYPRTAHCLIGGNIVVALASNAASGHGSSYGERDLAISRRLRGISRTFSSRHTEH
ncbi:hypothetical protein GA0115259_104102 [Streptomyces sp. MnatMP-M17]|nr:hypothetical protein GA0115259_104102 [Streptomyces sp. MnatMP-M17]